MATSFFTQLVEIGYDAAMIEAAKVGILMLPVYGPSFDVYRSEHIEDPGLKGRARNDANRTGAQWAEFPFYLELCGFETFTAEVGLQLGGADACTNVGVSTTEVTCATATFVTDGVAVGDKVINVTTSGEALVTSVDSETVLTTAAITGSYTATDSITVWQMLENNPPYWGSLCSAMGMKKTGIGATAAWSYEVVDEIHLSDDTVHTSGELTALQMLINVDGYYFVVDNGVMNGEFSWDVDEGPPRLTITEYKGNIYEDTSANFYPYPTTDIPADITVVAAYEPPKTSDAKNITLALSVIPNDGTYTPVAVTSPCPRRWRHNVGNNIQEQRCAGAEYKLDQFLVSDQNANQATLVVKVQDPGTYIAPAAFNPYAMITDGDMLDFSAVHRDGDTLNQITWICDYYISDVVGVQDDGAGVLEYTLTLQQANLQPDGSAAQYLKISLA